MKLKKCLAMGLCGAMAVSFLSGCDGGKGEQIVGSMTKEEIKKFEADAGGLKLPLDKNGTEISFMSSTSSTGMTDSTVIKELSRRTGAKIKVIEIPSATIKEKAKVLVASKDQMPDVVTSGFTNEELNDLGMQGAFEPIDKHIDELPNFKDIFIDRAEELQTEKAMKGWKAPDGHMYLYPSYDCNRSVNHGMLYRKDIFDKHGIPMWNSPETFYDALKKLKSIYPKSTPMVSKSLVQFFNQIAASWGVKNWPTAYYDEGTKQWKYAATSPEFKQVLDFVKKLYDEELLDPEFLTCTQAAWTTKMTQKDQAFVTFDWIDRMDIFKEQTKNTIPEYDLRFGNPMGPIQKVISLSPITTVVAFKKTEKTELAMKVVDYLISPGGAELMTCGMEGVTFNWNADKTFANYIGLEEQTVNIRELETKYGMFLNGIYRRFDRRSTYFNYTPTQREAQDLMANKQDGGFLMEDPAISYMPEEKEVVTKYDPKLRKTAEEFATKYILSNETGDAAWNQYLKAMENQGVNEIIRVANEAQKRYDAQ